MPTVVIDGKQTRLDSSRVIGKGGEADVYKLNGHAVKLYKTPRHPDVKGNATEQQAAQQRLIIAQRKLPAFPAGLPGNVVGPEKLTYDTKGNVSGFMMPLIDETEAIKRLCEKSWRDRNNVSVEQVMKLFTSLHSTVQGIHQAQAVIGDFNDLNVLFKESQVFIIDADSMQYDGFPCTVFTTRFSDPLILAENNGQLTMTKPFSESTDWYAFAVLLMQSLLYVDPYGGVYRPADKAKRISPALRPLQRINVFNDEVRYPRPAIDLGFLPKSLYEYFYEVFTNDLREDFPFELLSNDLWKNKQVPLAKLLKADEVFGDVTAIVVRNGRDKLATVDLQGDKLYWLGVDSADTPKLVRENGLQVLSGELNPRVRYKVAGTKTVFAMGTQAVIINEDGTQFRQAVDNIGGMPVIDTNRRHVYWVNGGELKRDDPLVGEVTLGNVLDDQTLIWVGSEFGIGIYRAAELEQVFLFDAESPGINDSLNLPKIPGQLIDLTAKFGNDTVWFFASYQHLGVNYRQCTIVNRTGQVLANEKVQDGDDSWLETIRGHSSAGNALFVATDEGIKRIEIVSGNLKEVAHFPGTANFVDQNTKLYVHSKGIYANNGNEILDLNINLKGKND